MKHRSSTIRLFIILLLLWSASAGGCSLNSRLRAAQNTTPTPAKSEEKPQPQPPKVEEVMATITEDRSPNKATLILKPLVLSHDQESLFTATLSGDWDQRHALVERSNHEDQSKYKVWVKFEWKSSKPFPIGDEVLHFVADEQRIDVGRVIVFFPMSPLEPGDPYLARITTKIALNYLERIAMAQRVEMRLGDFKLNLDQNALSKLKEFTDRALRIRSEQLAKRL